MRFLSDDGLEVIQRVRRGRPAREAVEADFTTPTGDDERFVAVPGPGVIHPAHIDWVAEALGLSREKVVEQINGQALSALIEKLGEVKSPVGPHRVTASELVMHWLPVPPGSERPNAAPFAGANPVVCLENTAWKSFVQNGNALKFLIDHDMAPIIGEHRAAGLQREFESLTMILNGHGPRSRAQAADDTSPELIIAPSTRPGFNEQPMRPFQVGLREHLAFIRYRGALVRVDLRTGELSTHAFAGAPLVTMSVSHAIFCDGSRLNVFDVERDQFVLEAPSVPRHVVLGACCGVDILDTVTRQVATMPGPNASSGYDVVISACGRYGWLDIVPEADDLGIFSIEAMAPVFQPWPHATLGHPNEVEDLGEGHDGTVRAFVRRSDGTFVCLYGKHLMRGAQASALAVEPMAAGFDDSTERLATADLEHLSVFRLSASGSAELESRWSLAPLAEHLTADALDLSAVGIEADALLGAVGTISALANMTVDELVARLFFETEPSHEALSSLIASAKRTLSSRLVSV